MLFSTFEFLFIFFPIVFLVHESRFLRFSVSRQLLWLTLVSLFFSSVWETRSFVIIFSMLAANLALLHCSRSVPKKLFLALGLMINLLPLIYFKYTAFILGNLGLHLNADQLRALRIDSLPLAISFYSFVALTYVVDAYQQKIKEHSPLKYAFFVTFFPHLIAGPIVHHSDLVPQIGQKTDRAALFYEGLIYLAIGLVKKIMLADPIGYMVDAAYASAANAAALNLFDAITATLGYTLQIYFDFSGYSDMAVGLGLMLGYRLPINFNSPYKAGSITDFWRRWHITLSRLMREYVYFRLGGNRRGKVRQLANLMVTMLVSGLWHGAGWTFVLWGAGHGVLMVLERVAAMLGWPSFTGFMARAVKIALTFAIVNLLWVLFRAEDLGTALKIYQGLANFDSLGSMSHKNMAYCALGLLLLALPNSHALAARAVKTGGRLKEIAWNTARESLPGLVLGVICCLAVLGAFYTTRMDRYLYSVLPIERSKGGISNRVGDYRSNLFSSPLFAAEGKKIVIVGASFTEHIGYLLVQTENGQTYHSGTLGMGGNPLVIGLRTALAVFDHEDVEILVLGVSPLNFGPMRNYEPFRGQLYDRFPLIGLSVVDAKYASASPISRNPLELVSLFLNLNGESKFQFRNFLYKLKTAFGLASYNDPRWVKLPEIIWELYTPGRPADMRRTAGSFPPLGQLPADLNNGAEAKFHWLERGIFSSMEPGGDVYKALTGLARLCEEKGVRLLVYSTPTASHQDAPQIYPRGFYEEYQRRMLELTQKNGIEYYDLSFWLPWDRAYMNDFIHPHPPARELVHKHLIDLIMENKQ